MIPEWYSDFRRPSFVFFLCPSTFLDFQTFVELLMLSLLISSRSQVSRRSPSFSFLVHALRFPNVLRASRFWSPNSLVSVHDAGVVLWLSEAFLRISFTSVHFPWLPDAPWASHSLTSVQALNFLDVIRASRIGSPNDLISVHETGVVLLCWIFFSHSMVALTLPLIEYYLLHEIE